MIQDIDSQVQDKRSEKEEKTRRGSELVAAGLHARNMALQRSSERATSCQDDENGDSKDLAPQKTPKKADLSLDYHSLEAELDILEETALRDISVRISGSS